MTHNPKQIDAATAMMFAAEYVEQEGRFDYDEVEVPRTCDGVGCALGWVGYVIGSRCIIDTAEKIGFDDDAHFYKVMRETVGDMWQGYPALAATGLRKLAQERMK